MNGNLESHVPSGENQEFKFSKSIDEDQIFGLKKFYTEQRPDFAKVISQKAVIIEFNTKTYFDVISKTQLSASEKKIEFLIRYVPNFRQLD